MMPPVVVSAPAFRLVDDWWRATVRQRRAEACLVAIAVAWTLYASARAARRATLLTVAAAVAATWYRHVAAHSAARTQYHFLCKVEMQLGQTTPVVCKPPWVRDATN